MENSRYGFVLIFSYDEKFHYVQFFFVVDTKLLNMIEADWHRLI